MHTSGLVSQDTPVPDAQIFISPVDFTSAIAVTLSTGIPIVICPASTTLTGAFSISGQILRTGILQSAPSYLNQEAFGTAAGVPGPSAVANTSGPLAIFGRPPFTKANTPTLATKTGALPKGLQINTLDFLYAIATNPATSVTGGLSRLVPPAAATNAAFTISQDIAATALAVAVSAGGSMTRARLTVPTPAMYTVDGMELTAPFVATTPASSTLTLYGLLLGVSYNYN